PVARVDRAAPDVPVVPGVRSRALAPRWTAAIMDGNCLPPPRPARHRAAAEEPGRGLRMRRLPTRRRACAALVALLVVAAPAAAGPVNSTTAPTAKIKEIEDAGTALQRGR